MRALVERIVGIALILGATVGLIFNGIGLFYLPSLQRGIAERVNDTLDTLDGTLVTTEEGLLVLERSLSEAALAIETAEATTRDVSQALGDTAPLFDTVEQVAGQDLLLSLAATHAAVDAAREGALAIEAVLFALNGIPFLDAPLYNPDAPLANSLEAITTSLDPLPESLLEIEDTVVVAGENLAIVEEDVALLAANLEQISTTLEEAQGVTDQYFLVIDQQQALIADLQANADNWITWSIRIFAMIIIWLVIAQLGLLSQGIEMVLRSRDRRRVEAVGGRLGDGL